MNRALAVITLLLALVILADRIGRRTTSAATISAAGQNPGEDLPPAPVRGSGERLAIPDNSPGNSASAGSNTPAIDRMVVLSNRQRLDRQQRHTYLDSLLVESDSLIRRWPDASMAPLRVFIVEAPEVPGWTRRQVAFVQRAEVGWTELLPALRLARASSIETADIVVRWQSQFDFERTGQTDIRFFPDGTIQGAVIHLALNTYQGVPLSDEGLQAVAFHELGHALGLPHSADLRDIMFPDTRVVKPSGRDRATLVLLYELSPGSLRLAP